MEPPIEPKQEDCCNSGCNPCIFDVYEKKLKLFRSGEKSVGPGQENGISELNYTKFIISDTKSLCDSHKILSFKRVIQNNTKVFWKPGDHFLYKYISGSLTCTRAYTPIKLNSKIIKDFDFDIVVKRYENGLVSNHLFNLKEGESALWRGPYGSYILYPNKFNRIIMIAQGTGIVPFISIIEEILTNEDDMTKIFLYYCVSSLNEILFRDELYFYKSYWNFSYEIFLAHITDIDVKRYQEPIHTRRFSYEDLNKVKQFSNDQFLLCGSLKFMKMYSDALNEKLDQKENVILF